MEEFLQGDEPLEDPEGMEEVFATLSSMKTEVELMRRPLGTFESPARTCKELMMVQPDYKDGKQRRCFIIDACFTTKPRIYPRKTCRENWTHV